MLIIGTFFVKYIIELKLNPQSLWYKYLTEHIQVTPAYPNSYPNNSYISNSDKPLMIPRVTSVMPKVMLRIFCYSPMYILSLSHSLKLETVTFDVSFSLVPQIQFVKTKSFIIRHPAPISPLNTPAKQILVLHWTPLRIFRWHSFCPTLLQ